MTTLPASPLVDASWLAAQLSTPGLRLIDCRHRFDDPSYGERVYRSGHIPGAIHFSLQPHLTGTEGDGRSPLPSEAEFTAVASEAGIGGDDIIVCYDDGLGGIAARAWWLFRYFGHDKVFVLRDGFASWTGAVETGEPPSSAPRSFPIRPSLVSHIRASDVLSGPSIAIIDARGTPRFRGEAPPLDPVEGHVPGAINIPATAALLENERLQRVAATADRIIAYCGSGIVACNIVLACAELGRNDVELYAGSWSDWAQRRLPAQAGEEIEPLQFQHGGS